MTHSFGAAATLDPMTMVDSGHLFSTPTVTPTERGTRIIKGMRVFKTGQFSDSRGIVRNWTSEMLDLMVSNFRTLHDGGTFPNVPVRVNHSPDMNSVVGYITNLYRDSTDPAFLLGDIELTEPDAYAKWQRGTFRSRSLEVGTYSTNTDNTYWPTVMGLAFVDIPAVEGLHSKGDTSTDLSHFSQSIRDTHIPVKENPVTLEEWIAAGRTAESWGAACTYAAQVEADEAAAREADFLSACNYAAALDAHAANAQALGLVAAHEAHIIPPATFRINGAEAPNIEAVQGHITALETFRAETIANARSAFVVDLATHGRIAATQVDSMKALVATMGDAQYEAFTAAYKDAPAASLFQQHGTQSPGTHPGGDSVAAEIETLEEIVATHRRAGVTEDALKGNASFQRLQTLKSQK